MEELQENDRRVKLNAICASLRQNDPKLVHVSDNGLPKGYGAELGNALLQNNNQVVSSVSLCVSRILQEDATDTHDADGIVQYIRSSSQVLRKVKLVKEHGDHRPITVDVANLLLVAMMENGHIGDLVLHTEASPQIVTNLLESSSRLRSMNIDFDSFANDDASHPILAEGFGANTSLESLTLICGFYVNPPEPILRQLSGHPTLTTLHLNLDGTNDGRRHMIGLADFAQRNTVLHHLIIETCDFEEPYWGMFVQAIHSNKSIAILTLDSCRFDADATLSAHTLLMNGESRCNFQELHFIGGSDTFTGASFAHGVASVVAMDCPTIQCLVLGRTPSGLLFRNDENLADFFSAMAERPMAYRIPRLQLNTLKLQEADALIQFLPTTIFVQELTLCKMTNEVPLQNILQSIQQNGSLYHVAILSDDKTTNYLSPLDARLVDAYCKRNQLLPQLLQESQSPDLKLFPTLFKVAFQAPRTTLTVMLQGVLCSGESVGPKSIAKQLPLEHYE